MPGGEGRVGEGIRKSGSVWIESNIEEKALEAG